MIYNVQHTGITVSTATTEIHETPFRQIMPSNLASCNDYCSICKIYVTAIEVAKISITYRPLIINRKRKR